MGRAARAERKHGRRWRLPDALPSLGPVAMRIYVALWSLLLLASIVTPPLNVYFQTQRRADPTWDAIGLSVLQSANQRLVIRRVLTPQAQSAGLREGDVILAVEGAPAYGESVALVGQRLLGPEGSLKRLAVSSNGAPARQVTLRRSVADIEASYHAAGITSAFWDWFIAANSLFVCLQLIVTAVLLFGRRRQPVAALLSAGYLAVTGFGVFSSNVQAAFNLQGALVMDFIRAAGWGCIFVAILAFPDGSFRPRWSLAVVAAAVLLYSVATPLRLLSPAWFDVTNGAVLAACIAVLAIRYRGVAPGIERQQLRWTFLGFAGGAGLLIANILAREGITTLAHHEPSGQIWATLASSILASLAVSAWTMGLSVSLLRYRLYDADAVIGRSATFGVLTILLLGIFAGSEKIIEVLGEEYFGEGLGALAGGLGAAVAAVMLVPLHHRVNQWAERRFQKDLHNMRERLPLLVSDLRETAGLERIGAAVIDAVTQGVRASRAALLVGEKIEGARGIDVGELEAWRSGWKPAARDGLDCDRRDPLFPMRVALEADGHGKVGWLLLGPRPDGSFFGKDERAALAEVADPIARAVEVARERELERADRRDAMSALRREMAELREEVFQLLASRHPAAE